MTSSRLRNNFLRGKTTESKTAYNKQRNYYVNLVCNEKKNYYGNIDITKITDNKKLWKIIHPLFSSKTNNSDKITLIKHNNIISENIDVQ